MKEGHNVTLSTGQEASCCTGNMVTNVENLSKKPGNIYPMFLEKLAKAFKREIYNSLIRNLNIIP